MRTRMGHMMLAALVVATGACDRAENGQKPPPSATVSATGAPTTMNRVEIVVDERGYTPNSVSVAKGSPVTLSFKRTTDATCATEVVFPDLHVEKPLPVEYGGGGSRSSRRFEDVCLCLRHGHAPRQGRRSVSIHNPRVRAGHVAPA